MIKVDLKNIGHCWHIAIALKRIKEAEIGIKSKLVLLYGWRWDHYKSICDEDVEKVLIHAGIESDGFFEDLEGPNHSPIEVLDFFSSINERYSETEILTFDSEKDPLFLEYLSDSCSKVNEKEIQRWMRILRGRYYKKSQVRSM